MPTPKKSASKKAAAKKPTAAPELRTGHNAFNHLIEQRRTGRAFEVVNTTTGATEKAATKAAADAAFETMIADAHFSGH
ncbi:MAG: hypothetical protein EOP50_00500 [Sphingobacteriales bacterium]|nr:MAG: hypothetical protein EOP50_00500 [Sphingobacteriales bacterium]